MTDLLILLEKNKSIKTISWVEIVCLTVQQSSIFFFPNVRMLNFVDEFK